MIDTFRGQHYFLSNFARAAITSEGVTYPTVEHYFQAHKTFDPVERGRVAAAETPVSAKHLGRKVTLRPDWDAVKLNVMRDALRLKFPDPACSLGWHLRSTGDQWIQEGNTWGDTFWGVCRGQGRNWLGHLLMARRAELASPDFRDEWLA